jgi:hypothetical protein
MTGKATANVCLPLSPHINRNTVLLTPYSHLWIIRQAEKVSLPIDITIKIGTLSSRFWCLVKLWEAVGNIKTIVDWQKFFSSEEIFQEKNVKAQKGICKEQCG